MVKDKRIPPPDALYRKFSITPKVPYQPSYRDQEFAKKRRKLDDKLLSDEIAEMAKEVWE